MVFLDILCHPVQQLLTLWRFSLLLLRIARYSHCLGTNGGINSPGGWTQTRFPNTSYENCGQSRHARWGRGGIGKRRRAWNAGRGLAWICRTTPWLQAAFLPTPGIMYLCFFVCCLVYCILYARYVYNFVDTIVPWHLLVNDTFLSHRCVLERGMIFPLASGFSCRLFLGLAGLPAFGKVPQPGVFMFLKQVFTI